MDRHFDADGNVIHSIADVPDIPQKKDSCCSVARQKDGTPDTAAQTFRAKVDQILEALQNVDRIIEKHDDGTLVYKREGKQARTSCCEAEKDIPWPVLYSGDCESAQVCFPSTSYLVEYLGATPPKDMLTYYCPFIGCNCESKGSPNYRHLNEQHLLFHAKVGKQPVLCTIGNCGLYLKRPDEKMKEHRNSTHRHEIVRYTDKTMQLPAPTCILLAALHPEEFYEAGFNYYKEECEYKATKVEIEEEEPSAPRPTLPRKKSKAEVETPAPKGSSRNKRSKIAVEPPAPKPRPSRKKPKIEAEDANEETATSKPPNSRTGKLFYKMPKEDRHYQKEPCKTIDGIEVAHVPLPIDFKLEDGLADSETSSCEDIFDEPTMVLGESFGSFSTTQGSCYWCDEDEDSFSVDAGSFPYLYVPPEEFKESGQNNFEPLLEFDRFVNLKVWSSGPMRA